VQYRTMPSAEHLRKQAEEFFTLAQASGTKDVGLVYALQALEFLSEADAAEPEHPPDRIEARVLGEPERK